MKHVLQSTWSRYSLGHLAIRSLTVAALSGARRNRAATARERFSFAVACCIALALGLVAAGPAIAEEAQLEASPALFSVLSAINATGYDADLQSPNNHPLRQAIRQELSKKNIPILGELRRFVAHRKKSDPGAN